MPFTRIFCTGITSPFELLAGDANPGSAADVAIRLHAAESLEDTSVESSVFTRPGRVTYTWAGEARYEIQPAAIDIHPFADDILPAIRESLLGGVLAFAMDLRGELVFHGASIEIPRGGCCLILGDSGLGKSTLSAYALTQGAKLLGEEVAVLAFKDTLAVCRPSWPLMRLPEAIAHEGGLAPCPAVAVTEGNKKAWLVPGHGFSQQEVPLQKIVVLRRGINCCATLPPGEALKCLLEQVYTRSQLDTSGLQRYFNAVTSLLQRIPVIALSSEEGTTGIEYALKHILQP